MAKCKIFYLFMLVCFIERTSAAITFEMYRDANQPGKCVVATPDYSESVILNSGEDKKYPGRCAQVYCGLDGWALLYTCDSDSPPAKCQFGDYLNIGLAYPDCCQREIVCENAIDEISL